MSDFSDVERIRKRPGMYIGGTGVRGLHHLPNELIANSIDEFLVGRATRVFIEIEDGVVTVTDDGSGLPFDQPSEMGYESRATEFTQAFHNSASADDHAPHIHFDSVMGVGLTAVNALSQFFVIESFRGEKLYRQKFAQGRIETPVEIIDPKTIKPFFFDPDVAPLRGTRITYKADGEIFKNNITVARLLRLKSFDGAHLFPGLIIGIQQERFCAPDGLAALARMDTFTGNADCFSLNCVTDDVTIQAAAIETAMKPNEVTAVRWKTWANGTRTWYHESAGTHQDAFAEALEEVNWMPEKAFIHVVMHQPEFAGPTKSKLDIPEKKDSIRAALSDALHDYCRKKKLGKFA